MIKKIWGGVTKVGALALVTSVGMQVWDRVTPEKPVISEERMEAADEVVPTLVESLRGAREKLRSAALPDIIDDDSGYLTHELRTAITQHGILNLRDQSLARRVQRTFGSQQTDGKDLASAVAYGKSLGVEVVVFGAVHRFESSPDGAALELTLNMADVETGKLLLTKRFVRGAQPPPAAATAADGVVETIQRRQSTWWIAAKRFIGWLLVVLLLPVFTIGFIRSMARRDTNMSNLVTVLLYTSGAALLAFLLIGSSVGVAWRVILIVAAASAAFFYNGYMMRVGMDLEGQM